jgi:hypothetical protein
MHKYGVTYSRPKRNHLIAGHRGRTAQDEKDAEHMIHTRISKRISEWEAEMRLIKTEYRDTGGGTQNVKMEITWS